MQFFPTTDEDFQYFRAQGYTGSINDMHFTAMGDLGYTGALTDRIHAYLVATFGSYHEAMRDLRNGTSVFSLISAYGINSLEPDLVLDFASEYYRTDGTASTFSDAVTHSRTGNATMVDADGLLKWAPHNLLKYSEDFTNGAWLRALANITASPNDPLSGFSTLSRFTTTSVSNPYLLQSGVTVVSGVDYTFEMIVKYVDTQWVRFQNQEAETVWFDLLNGVVGTQTNATGKIEALSEGFYRVAIEFDANDTSTYLLFTTSQTDGGGLEAIGSVDVQAATAYRSDLGGMVNNPDTGNSYVPTTTAAVYSPRRGNHVYNGSAWVNEGLLHESAAATNLLINSSDFTAWSAINATLANTGSAAPDGSASWKLTDNGSASFHGAYLQNAFTVGAGFTTWSVMCREGTARYVAFAPRSAPKVSTVNVSVIFDLQTGVFTDTGAGPSATYIDGYGSENLGGGWWRIHLKSDLASANYDDIGVFISTDGLYANLSYTGSGDYIDFAFAQIETGSIPTSYIPTAGATATRAAETLTVAAANMPWPTPVETTGTELVTNGTFDTDTTGWTAFSAATSISAAGGVFVQELVSGAASTAYTSFSTEVGKVYSAQVEVTALTGGATNPKFYIGPSAGSGSVLAVAGTTVGTLSGTFVATTTTTYLHTEGRGSLASTVSFDNISVKEINPLSVSIQMDGLMTYADNDLNPEIDFYDWNAAGVGYIKARMQTNFGSGRFQTLQAKGAVLDSIVSSNDYYSPSINVPFNFASRHGSTFINGAIDGVALTANTTPTALPDLSATDFQIGQTFLGNIGILRVWADDIGDTGIAEASA